LFGDFVLAVLVALSRFQAAGFRDREKIQKIQGQGLRDR